MSLSRTSHQRTLRGGKTPLLGNVSRQWRTSIPCLFLLLCYSPTLADDPAQTAKLVAAGDTALQNGDVSSALESYTQIPSPSDETIYNLGVAYYRNENLPLAAEQFRKVLGSQNDAVAAKARFNLGNTLYANALIAIAEPATNTQATAPPETSKRDVDTGIKFLRSAITQYRSSLRINNSDTDARANIELAQRLIQQEQQDQEQQDQ
ncbi:MAG: hypothetical protein OSA98_25560, partial [Rubripirellula sp.]|nr:hypothetical protein [Rubripirellula sp.]